MTEYLLAQLANALVLGSVYALIAIGFSLIYGIVRLVNFAHGEIVMIGAYSTWFATSHLGIPFLAALAVAALMGCGAGLLLERIAFRPIRGAPQVTGFVVSLAVSIVLQSACVMLLSAQTRAVPLEEYWASSITISAVSLRHVDALAIAGAVVLLAGIVYIVRYTRLGVAMRATAENIDVARLTGVRADRAIAVAFGLGSALAGVSGAVLAGKYGQIEPLIGVMPALKAFVAAVIGGVGSIGGAVLGSFLLAFAEIAFIGLLPPEYSGLRNTLVFGLLFLILLVSPHGLLGRSTEERA